MSEPTSRFEAVTRRTFMKRAAAFGVAAAFGLSACADDGQTFATASSTTGPTAATSTTTVAATTVTEAQTTTTVATTGGEALAAGTELLLSFTYSASSAGSGPARNPYVAVWVEDTGGELVDTVALWFLQSQKGTRWLSDLRRWYSVDGSNETISTISSATRTPGDYSLVWDLTDLDGNPIGTGDYYVCIEAAREHGPYSLIREPITLATEAFAAALPDDEELTNASVELVVA